MPDYRRKKIKKSKLKSREIKNNDNIIMEPKRHKNSNVIPQKNIKVINGNFYKRRFIAKFFISLLILVCSLFLIFSFILPVSIYENVVNAAALIGHGKFPIDIPGSTVINCHSTGNYYFTLTDTSITAYSNNGKFIFTDLHGFSNPVMSISETRVMVYDQGGTFLNIYNLGGKIHSFETENEIISANISRSGSYAISTHSNSFTSVVEVYNKKFKKIYAWNSAKDIITNVLINPKGNRLAVTTLNASSGQYVSKAHILGFDSADPLFSVDFESSIGLSLHNTGKSVAVISNTKCKFINWSKFETTEISESGEINIVRKDKNGLLIVYNRANDRSDNTVILATNNGKKIKKFKINATITDIQYSKGRVYYINDVNVKLLDNDGNLLRKATCNYGTERFVVIAPNAIATVNNCELYKIDIQKGDN